MENTIDFRKVIYEKAGKRNTHFTTTYLSMQVTKFYEVLSSIDIEVNKTVFIY